MRGICRRPIGSPASVRRSNARAANASRRRGSGSRVSARLLGHRQRRMVQRVQLVAQAVLLEVRVEGRERLLPQQRRHRIGQQQRARRRSARWPASAAPSGGAGEPAAGPPRLRWEGRRRVRSSPQRRLRPAQRARPGVATRGRGCGSRRLADAGHALRPAPGQQHAHDAGQRADSPASSSALHSPAPPAAASTRPRPARAGRGRARGRRSSTTPAPAAGGPRRRPRRPRARAGAIPGPRRTATGARRGAAARRRTG